MYYAILMKWLILLFVVWLAWRLLQSRRRAAPPPERTQGGEAMRSCVHCGLNVPASEALSDSDGLDYCSEAHRRLGPRSGK